VEILVQTPLGIRHVDRVFDNDDTFHVPHLLDIETLQAIGRLTLAGEITSKRADAP
jgi:hypothetical protein